ncbi:AAEL016971-PA [Aedes aegypti]|uniref:limulus clotting factor C n=1 Tax=Aedes aegypti TaxID=7159 RepID=J9HJ91_AEDAE|nr:AAEL016971-PA [Aedes aegypti]
MNVPLNIQNLSGKRTSDDPDLEGAQLVCSFVGPSSTEKPLAGNDSMMLQSSQELFVSSTRARGHHRHCPRGKVPCADGIQCVLSSHLCDSRVDCFDGSDESHCSCLSRLADKRRCDGYVDCPLAEDEMGCFGCDKFSFSCFNTFFEYQASHHSETRCFTLIEKCDGFNNCMNRKDEQDCTMLVRDLRSPLAFAVGHSVGVLHRNYKGKWYPVCHNPLNLAREACEAELGPADRDPVILQHHGDLPGPFIQPSPRSHHVFQPEFTDTCNGLINYVKCPAPKCGSSKQNEMENLRIKIRGKRNATELVQIVGGTKAEPAAYPFIVGIFRDGKFHCGGSIFNERWIVTAAHCCDNFPRHHYELRAGLLRRRSFSPQVQVSTVTHVFIHRGYSAQKMINDISLMHSDRPFQYNRWVRPICLPDRHMTTNDRDWIWGPKPGTMCTAVGWGALREHGGSPDHLMQVTVPILPFCKHKNDRDGLAICAAEMSGGHDACQGDSGGPFACISVSSPHEWYLAGVVSHGEGCARPNEPGVYTRVALFNDWIQRKTREVLTSSSTRQDCPGFQCSVGVSFCIPRQKRCNGKVDCLGGEDELSCSLDQLLAESIQETTIATTPKNSTATSSTTAAATTEAVTSKIDFLAENSEASDPATTVTEASSTETANIETILTTIETVSAKDVSDGIFQVSTEATTVEINTTLDISSSSQNVSASPEKVEESTVDETTSSTTETSFTHPTTIESETTADSVTALMSETTSPSLPPNENNTTVDYTVTRSTDQTTNTPFTISPTTDSLDDSSAAYSSSANDSEVNHSTTIEPKNTESSVHATTVIELISVESTTNIEATSLADPSNASITTLSSDLVEETSSSSTTPSTPDSTSSTQPDSSHSSTSSAPWMQINEAIANLKPRPPSTDRDMEMRQLELGDSVAATRTDNTTSTTISTAPSAATDSTSSTPLSTTTVESSSTTHGDLEHSETQIEPVEAEATNASVEEHPFLREIHNLVEEKTRRLNQFRLSMHYLHTSLRNQTQDANETSYQYRRFKCSKIRQSINIAHHCDRIIDCEDGTDELRCTCRDYLKDKYDFLICDGKTDCLDLTDEADCFSCTAGQFPCRMSKVCIDEKKLCDAIPDCPLHEDELDCLALTDGHKVYFDANNLSEFKYEGLVTKNTNGTWDLICGAEINNKSVESIGKICSFLGFAGYESYYQTVLTPLVNETVDLDHQPLLIMSYRNISSEPNCKALHITCAPFINATEHEISHFENQHKEQPVQVNIRPTHPIQNITSLTHITFQENAHIEFIENFGDDYDWPWNADIYLEGVFLCSAIIIEVNWIVVDSSCMRMINLKNDYLSVVAGGAKSYLKISGPYEQVVRVDCYHFLPEARVVMLHLAKNLTFTRHVLPTFIPEKNYNITDNQCLAVGQDKYGRTRTLRVHMNMTNCEPEDHICYQLNPDNGIYHADHCYTENASRTGVVVCKSKVSGWYPVGFYQNKHGLCGFNEVVKMISLKEFYTDIQHVLSHKKCDYEFPEPLCDGVRCWHGKCIGHSLVCDNKMDCDDNFDERPEACNAINDTSTACLPTQFRCGSHQCVDKSKFCDGRNDCGDLSDEPHECSCYTYLKVTDPSKICDGVRNCWDKSDENPRLCKCAKTSFRCGDSEVCIPYDHVCDDEIDCPGEEDERYCYALQQNPAETNYGEVMQQSYGIWHSKCFPKDDKYDEQTIKEICHRVGYQQVRKVYGRKVLPESRLRTSNRTHDPVDRLRGAATKAVAFNKFFKVNINEKQAIFMKPSRPLYTLVNWDAEDEQKCDRLEINCGD